VEKKRKRRKEKKKEIKRGKRGRKQRKKREKREKKRRKKPPNTTQKEKKNKESKRSAIFASPRSSGRRVSGPQRSVVLVGSVLPDPPTPAGARARPFPPGKHHRPPTAAGRETELEPAELLSKFPA